MKEQILSLVNQTNVNIFLTGKAGTGKTTLLRKIIEISHKNTVVVAPTGIAALNAGGVTIHSMFQLPFATFLPTAANPPIVNDFVRFENRQSLRRHFKMNKNKRQVLTSLELLIIDEVSMLRADVLDAMDFVLQSVRKNNLPFGGVQVLFIGDLLQLPPVVRADEWEVLKEYYEGMFFFQSKVITQNPLLYVELDKIYRQSDEYFISLLNNLRDNRLTAENVAHLQQYVKPDFEPDHDHIILTTHNAKADRINADEMSKLKGKEFVYEAVVVGDFPENMYPIDLRISLKEGARVMFVKNDWSGDKLFYNGKMGTVAMLADDEVEVLLDDGNTIKVEPYEWENIRYRVNEETKEIEEEPLGTFTQYPLRLAWAITVHKSQGLTFDRAVLDLDRVFASGQAYVAFSRLRSLNGLVLLSPINPHGIDNSRQVVQYATNRASENEVATACERGKKLFLENSIKNCFDWGKMLSLWRFHSSSYTGDIGKKSNYKDWAKTQTQFVAEQADIAEKFTRQLAHIVATEYDFPYLYERFDKAYNYFMPHLKTLWYEVLRVIGEISTLRQVKQYREELFELEDMVANNIRNLLKTRQIAELAIEGKPFEATNINNRELNRIREQLTEKALQHLRDSQLFVPNEIGGKRKKKEKKEKVSTYDVTLQMWQATQSVADIAEKRMLTEGTIYRHLSKLVIMGKLGIDEVLHHVLTNEKIEELTAAFDEQDNDEHPLTPIYEQFGGRYNWDELRLFKVHFKDKKLRD